MRKSEFRRFKYKELEAFSDKEMIKIVMRERLNRLQKNSDLHHRISTAMLWLYKQEG